jgi:O-antigen/teichoic acid export membrane protein
MALSKRDWSNVAANYVGTALAIGLPAIFNLLYFWILGSEAYGLIGIYASVLLFTVPLDVSFGRSASYESARLSASGSTSDLRSLLRTLQYAYCLVSGVTGLAVATSADWIVTNWVLLEQLDAKNAVAAVTLIGATLAVQQPRVVYLEILNGLRRQVIVNVLLIACALVRGFGTLLALRFVDSTIVIFFAAQACLAALETLTIAVVCWQAMGNDPGPPRLRMLWLKRVSHFGPAGLTMVAATAMTLADRIVLSRLLPLDYFGVYSFAAMVATILCRLSGPIASACFPVLVQSFEQKNWETIRRIVRQASQFIGVTVLAMCATVMVHGEAILRVANKGVVPEDASLVFTLMLAGNAANSLLHLPHSLQLVGKRASWAMWFNLVAAMAYIPILILLTPRFGWLVPPGLWLITQVTQMLLMIPAVHSQFFLGKTSRWYIEDLLLPAIAVAIPSGIVAVLFAGEVRTLGYLAISASVTALATVAAGIAAASEPRKLLLRQPTRTLRS